MVRIICLLAGYLFGSFPTAYLVVKRRTGQDIRVLGSGNMGTSNAAASIGKGAGALTLAGDAGKTALACLLCALLFPNARQFAVLYAGAGAVLGHDFPCWLRFHGGKGVAVTLVWMLLIDWRAALCVYGGALVCLIVFRYLAAGSAALACLFPLVCFLWGGEWETIAVTSALGVLMLWRHRGNFRRIRVGEEKRIRLSFLRRGKGHPSNP